MHLRGDDATSAGYIVQPVAYVVTINDVPVPITALNYVNQKHNEDGHVYTTTDVLCPITEDSVIKVYFYKAGDLNCDGRVDLYDLNILLNAYDQTDTQTQPFAAGHMKRDIFGDDSMVNGRDTSVIIACYEA